MRFYTYPPTEDYNWILRNIKQKAKPCVHEIVDIGIYDLLKEPHRHSKEKLKAWVELETSGWKVVPDCPDLTGEFKLETVDFDNTEYSWELLTKYYNPEDKHQIPVIQSNYGDFKSLNQYMNEFIGMYGKPEKIAVGSVCKMDGDIKASMMLKEVRRKFPDSWIHAFGLRFKALKLSWHFIDSFDSTSWTFPRVRNNPSCKNKKMCIKYFYDYLCRINELKFIDVDQTKLKIEI